MPKSNLVSLLEGNKQFVNCINERKPVQIAADGFYEFKQFQKPTHAILACADSRVAPELIFSKGFGEIFVVRSAGNIPDTYAIASLEFSVAVLGVSHIVVLGHTSCGAVKTAVQLMESGEAAPSPALQCLVNDIQTQGLGGSSPASLDEAIAATAMAGCRTLVEQSSILKTRYREGKLTIDAGVYSLESGEVRILPMAEGGLEKERRDA